MTFSLRQKFLLAATALIGAINSAGSVLAAEPAAKTREFLFTYQTTVTGLRPGQTARIWLPVPPSNEDQQVSIARQEAPGEAKIGKESKYGNQIFYVETKADAEGVVPLSITYRVKRHEVKFKPQSMDSDMREMELFLKADAKVPLGGKPLALLEGKSLPSDQVQLGRTLYDVVNDHMRYSKEGTGWGRGDAVWACDSRYGNCSDFHSLFISLARSKNLPAKFEMGFPLPDPRGQGEVPGYHCWAKFYVSGKGWVPVDISEADKNPKMKDYCFGNLTESRVVFSVGRDLTLTPKQDGPPLNFFIYPHVEVDGEPLATEKVKRKFLFEDLK